MQRARFARPGLLAIEQKAWGVELDERPGGARDRGFEEEGDAAVVTVRGPLLQRAEGWLALFCDSYDQIAARVTAAFASSCRRVILRIDSPGGDAPGCFELAREIRAMADASGKPLVAFAEGGMCCSAAYALAAVADEIVATPTVYVGSIGVFEVMGDFTARHENAGVRIVVVSSGEAKTDRNPDVAITDEAVARVQAHVDEFAGLFWQLCADMRGGSPDDYRALKGGVFLGASAVGVGLCDRVATWSEVVAGQAGTEESPSMATGKKSFDTAKEALRAVVDDEKCSEEERDKARKSLRALEDETPKPKEAEGGDDEQKKKDDEAKARAAEEEKKKEDEAKALAAVNSLALAKTVQEQGAEIARMKAEGAAKVESEARTALFAKRPDFSDAVKATLMLVPLAELEKAVKEWPRANATPEAAAAALLAAGGSASGGEKPPGYTPKLTAEEKRLLDSVHGKAPVGPKAAVRHGNVTQMPIGISQADAKARLAELEKENV